MQLKKLKKTPPLTLLINAHSSFMYQQNAHLLNFFTENTAQECAPN